LIAGRHRRPGSETFIRPATEEDVPAIHRLLAQLADATGLADKFHSGEDDLRRFGFSPRPMFDALLAERDDTVVGLCLFFYTFSSWRGTAGVYVQDLVVDRDARTGGVGRTLLVETARHARGRGVTHLRLSVQSDNADAIEFYRRLGLEHAADEYIFEAEGDAFDRLADGE
jgi:ribosomal protein S18 acetylase RimI-like enzyme